MGGDLYGIFERKALPESHVKFYITEVDLAIEALHKMGVFDHDLKPENILMDRQGHVAVSDYGTCKEFNSHKALPKGTLVGTPEYMALEIIKGKNTAQQSTGGARELWHMNCFLEPPCLQLRVKNTFSCSITKLCI